MNTKGFLLLLITVVIIGGSIGGAFAGGLALGRSQNDDSAPESAVFQQQFGGGQFPSGGLQGGRSPGGQLGGGLTGGQFSGPTSDSPPISSDGESATGQDSPTGFRGGAFGDRGGFGGILNGTVGTVEDDGFTVTTDAGDTQVGLGDDSIIYKTEVGAADDLSIGDQVLVIVTGEVESGEPVVAASVTVNSPQVGRFGGGGFGGGGFGGILNGTILTVDGNVFTVTTDSGETAVTLADDASIQLYEEGTIDDLTLGVRVLVVLSGDPQNGEPAIAVTVILNSFQGDGQFPSGGFGGRRRGQ